MRTKCLRLLRKPFSVHYEPGVTARLLPFTPAPSSVNLSDQVLKNIENTSQVSLERDINNIQERSNDNKILETEANTGEFAESK